MNVILILIPFAKPNKKAKNDKTKLFKFFHDQFYVKFCINYRSGERSNSRDKSKKGLSASLLIYRPFSLSSLALNSVIYLYNCI